MDNQLYLDHFETYVKVINHVDGAIGDDPALVNFALQEASVQ